MTRLALAFIAMFAASGGAFAADDPAAVIRRARAEARTVAPDAELVQIEFLHFGFAAGPGGLPDMSRPGPPKMAVLNFLSKTALVAFRVVVDINRDPAPREIAEAMRARGYKDLRVERGQVPFSPFTLPIPERIGDMNRAIETAARSVAADCAGAAGGCGLVSSAELHMHWTGPADKTGTPVWTIAFGQDPRTLKSVLRTIDATTGRAFVGRDLQPASYNDHATAPLQPVNLTVGHEFDAMWRAVVAAVRKQDPLYEPYAVSLLTYLRDRRRAPDRVHVAEAHIQFSRQTPSLMWDDLEAHVGWRPDAEDQAFVFFSEPQRRIAPGQQFPITLDYEKLPPSRAALKSLLDRFPENYAEIITTWSKGCEDLPTFTPGTHMWRCGVYVPTRTRTDLVFLWLTRAGNPHWPSGRAPLAGAYRAVQDAAPGDAWVWWTRMLRPEYSQYFLASVRGDRPLVAVCTNPGSGATPVRRRDCPK